MNLREFIEELEYLEEEYGGDINIRVAIQPRWPLAERISNVSVQEHNEDYKAPVLWLATNPVPSFENPYAPHGAWEGYYDNEEQA